MAERFEDTHIGYMLNKAKMPFFLASSYPHYTIEDGLLVKDTSDESKAIKDQASEGYKLLKKIADRQRRGMRIPKTWRLQLQTYTSLVHALEMTRAITFEWADEYRRSIRWVQSL